MKTNWVFGLMVPGLLLASTATTQANDIVDFLNAINGRSSQRMAPAAIQPAGFHHHGSLGANGQVHGGQALSSRDLYKIHTANRNAGYSGPGHLGYSDARLGGSRFDDDRVNFRNRDFRQPDYGRATSSRSSRAQISFRVSSNSGVPRGYPQAHVLPHQLGEIVDCGVPLSNSVRVRNARNIAPNAVPIVVAVRDPSLCAHDHDERVVYVQVFAPPCPPRSITISPCRTRVTLCFGRYDVEIRSVNDVVVVDYVKG